MKRILTPEEVRLMLALAAGEDIEASDQKGTRWNGRVDVLDPSKGFVWIHTHHGERILLDIHEHTIKRSASHLEP